MLKGQLCGHSVRFETFEREILHKLRCFCKSQTLSFSLLGSAIFNYHVI